MRFSKNNLIITGLLLVGLIVTGSLSLIMPGNLVLGEQQASFTPWNDDLGLSGVLGGDGTVTVNGFTFDPVAAAKAMLAGAWNDINFLNMLKAYAIDNPNTYSSVSPTALLNFIEGAAAGSVQIAKTQLVQEKGETVAKVLINNANNPDDWFSQKLQDAYDTQAAQAEYAVKNQGVLEKWLESAKDGDYNADFGLIKKNGVIYYASNTDTNGDGVPDVSNLQAVTLTKYMQTGSWSGLNSLSNKIPTTSGGASIDVSAYGKLTAAQKALVDEFISTHPGAGLDSNGKLYQMVNGVKYVMGGPGGGTDLTVANEKLAGAIVTSDPNKTACEEAFGADSWLSDGSGNGSGTGHTAGSTGSGSNGSSGSGSSSGGGSSGKSGSNGGSSGEITKIVVPIVTNTTGSNQIKSTFELTVNTDRNSGCQYKQGSSFTYGSGLTFDTTGGTSHSTKLYSLTTGNYNYYVVCRDTATGGVSAAITVPVTVDLARDDNNKPIITNNTDATLTSATSTLAVNTDRPSKCEYKALGSFTFGTGTPFDTTGSYSHNTDITGLTNGSYNYYAVCQDVATKAISNAFKITFTVDLSAGSGNVPQVSNVTAVKQTEAVPVLAVTTNLPSTCRYSTTSGFTFTSGTLLTTANGYAHSVSIAALTDATYTFYVVCKSNTTSTSSSQLSITTTIDRPDSANNQPKITVDTLAYQTTSPAIISVKTAKAATCQYSTNSFAWGSGTVFATTGVTTHSVTFPGLKNGQHSYYVVCKDLASGEYNSTATQVIFVLNVNSGASDCASLASNDRANDSERSTSGSGKNDSSYLWQAVENGKREKFDKVDWFAGYQFSLSEDGVASELCGYFAKGEKNSVAIFNGSYKTVAAVDITGTGDWECVKIDPITLKADTRYYVIARINGQSVYYEYKSGFLPVDTGKAVIEAGVRQSVNSTFNKDIVKYDYMIFGLVDVKISYSSESNEGPNITSVSPSGTISNNSAFLSVETDKGATCKFSRDDVEFDDMKYTLPEVNDGTFSQLVCNLDDGEFTFYVRCKKGQDVNDASKPIEFTVQ